MNALVLAAGVLLGMIGFVVGAIVGSKNLALFRVQVFRSLDHLIGMIEEICALTHDRHIAPGVVVDQLNQIKYGLGLPDRVEQQEDLHPGY